MNKGYLRGRKNITALSLDFDGSATRIHEPRIYNIIGERILEALPADLRRSLGNYSFKTIFEENEIPVGWFLDPKRGYLLLPRQDGVILEGRVGNEILPDNIISKIYHGRIQISTVLEPDQHKDYLMFIGDGFDFVQAMITTALASRSGLPKRRTLESITAAVRSVHDNVQAGFKADLMKSPGDYGIVRDEELISLLQEWKQTGRKLILNTSTTQVGYLRALMEAVGLNEIEFDAELIGVKKPGCFYNGHADNLRLLAAFESLGLQPANVAHFGDHFYKDCQLAKGLGLTTHLRMPKTHLIDQERKLLKYAGEGANNLEETGGFRIRKLNGIHTMEGTPNPSQFRNLSYFLAQVYTSVDTITPNLAYMRPVLL